MERSGPAPSTSRRACLFGGSAGGAPTDVEDCHSCWTAAGHMYVLVCICIHLVSECAPTRQLPPLFLSSPLAAALVEAWMEGLLWLLALAGPAADLKNVLLRRLLDVLCCRLCLTFAEKQHGKKSPNTLRFSPGLMAWGERFSRSRD